MALDISRLRELIRTGEFLEEHYSEGKVWNQWIFQLEDFLKDNGLSGRLSSQIRMLKFHGNDGFARGSFDSIMGFLRHAYDGSGSENKQIASDSQSVFIIHGHDDGLIDQVKKSVTELGLIPIVLREQPNNGHTIIEKLESYLGNCKCAIVLYTPCDTGKAVSEENFEERARQNVVYEHGLFQGHLGRKRTLVLRKGDTKLPGDCGGLVYTSVEDSDWAEKLKNEIKNIDTSKMPVQ